VNKYLIYKFVIAEDSLEFLRSAMRFVRHDEGEGGGVSHATNSPWASLKRFFFLSMMINCPFSRFF